MGPNTGTPNFNQAPQPRGVAAGGNNLPQYNVDQTTTPNSGVEKLNQGPLQREQLSATAEQIAQPSQAVPIMTQLQQPAVQQPVVTQPASSAKPIDPKQVEKIWVSRTQLVIDQNKDNPYELAHQISQLMKGYLRDRYGKIIGSQDNK